MHAIVMQTQVCLLFVGCAMENVPGTEHLGRDLPRQHWTVMLSEGPIPWMVS